MIYFQVENQHIETNEWFLNQFEEKSFFYVYIKKNKGNK